MEEPAETLELPASVWETLMGIRHPLSAAGASSSSVTCNRKVTDSPKRNTCCLASKSSEIKTWEGLFKNPTVAEEAAVSESYSSPTSPLHAHTVVAAEMPSTPKVVMFPDPSVTSSLESIWHLTEPISPVTLSVAQEPSPASPAESSATRNTSTKTSGRGSKAASRTEISRSTELAAPFRISSEACTETPAGRALVCAKARVMKAAICARVTRPAGPN